MKAREMLSRAGMQSSELNSPQTDAVAHVDGPLLVFAGAGSGKTRVITYRIANLVATHRVPPYRILAVTFTNKAASEMRSRLESLLGPDISRDLWVGTFHATCAKLLRLYGASIGVGKNFLVYDAQDQKTLVTRVVRELGLDEREYPPRTLLGAIQKQKQDGRGPDEMNIDSYSDRTVRSVYASYEAALRAANAVDFEDLILLTVRLVESNSEEAESIRRRFDFVLVDEFQDTNATQYRLLRALTRDHRNLCVVGDDDQSIYRWRGADVRNIRGYKLDFPDAVVIKLEQNYRSTAHIVSAALAIIAKSYGREAKQLWTANDAGAPIELVAARDERDEAGYVIGRIREAVAAGVDRRQIALFYRVHAQSRVFEEALRASNLPYRIVGGMKFYERAEIKDALAYLRLVANPKSDVDFVRVVNTPARGIGDTTIERLSRFARANDESLLSAASHVHELGELGAAAKKKLAAFCALIEQLASSAAEMTPTALFDEMIEKSGYANALSADRTVENETRLENLKELRGSFLDFEPEMKALGETPTLEAYLERVSLQTNGDTPDSASSVTLMTVHGAKGLEFDVVFLTGMEEDMFPYRNAQRNSDEEMEEERRLAYVAVTRARKKLVVTHAASRQVFGTTRTNRPSRFVRDIPTNCIQTASTRLASIVAESEPHWSRPAFRKPLAGAAPPQEGRYVDREYFSDDTASDFAPAFRKGARVMHERFGIGEVRRSDPGENATVTAFFQGWGEKKILAKFLRPL